MYILLKTFQFVIFMVLIKVSILLARNNNLLLMSHNYILDINDIWKKLTGL